MDMSSRIPRVAFIFSIVSLFGYVEGITYNVAFVIPLHPPKFKHMAAFLDSYESVGGVNADISTVFSSREDSEEFAAVHHESIPEKGYLPLVYNGSAARLAMNPIFYKKYWAIFTLLDAYNFFFLVDSEIKILKSFDAEELASTIHYRKIFYGSEPKKEDLDRLFRYINEQSMYNFLDLDRQRLHVINRNSTVYFWYNEIPVVEAKTAKRYLEYIAFREDITDHAKADITGANNAFDFLSYSYYCLLYDNFALINVGYLAENIGPSFGEGGGGDANLLRITRPHWALEETWLKSKNKFDQQNIVMLFHCDRH